ncbi:MAG: flavodoxin domain-containing protein [Catonella sp.]|nr:flavodoxin domain-containing protein [Catonella sp.]MDY6356329.1 flavodoxin domain-containing protein [Catonella sp.]
MGKTVILYYSKHHGNTKKLVDAIAKSDDIDLIDVTETTSADLSGYDKIGIASGIYAGQFPKPMVKFVESNLPEGKPVFIIITSASGSEGYFNSMIKKVEGKGCKIIGKYSARGYCTWGPFKIVGGVSKERPTEEEISGAVDFYKKLSA